MRALIAALLLAGVNIADEGVHKGPVLELDCRGAGVSCTVSGSVARMTVSPTSADGGTVAPLPNCGDAGIATSNGSTWACDLNPSVTSGTFSGQVSANTGSFTNPLDLASGGTGDALGVCNPYTVMTVASAQDMLACQPNGTTGQCFKAITSDQPQWGSCLSDINACSVRINFASRSNDGFEESDQECLTGVKGRPCVVGADTNPTGSVFTCYFYLYGETTPHVVVRHVCLSMDAGVCDPPNQYYNVRGIP